MNNELNEQIINNINNKNKIIRQELNDVKELRNKFANDIKEYIYKQTNKFFVPDNVDNLYSSTIEFRFSRDDYNDYADFYFMLVLNLEDNYWTLYKLSNVVEVLEKNLDLNKIIDCLNL
jgi:hypothetical protein